MTAAAQRARDGSCKTIAGPCLPSRSPRHLGGIRRLPNWKSWCHDLYFGTIHVMTNCLYVTADGRYLYIVCSAAHVRRHAPIRPAPVQFRAVCFCQQLPLGMSSLDHCRAACTPAGQSGIPPAPTPPQPPGVAAQSHPCTPSVRYPAPAPPRRSKHLGGSLLTDGERLLNVYCKVHLRQVMLKLLVEREKIISC